MIKPTKLGRKKCEVENFGRFSYNKNNKARQYQTGILMHTRQGKKHNLG